MKKTVILSLIIILLGASVGFVAAKQGSDDKSENDRKASDSALEINDDRLNRSVASVLNSNKIVSPQDSKFSVTVKQDGMVKIQGKVVTSPSAVASANRISVQSWFGTYTVDTTNAKVIRRSGGAGSITDIQVGDMIVFDGKANQADMVIAATLIRDLSAWTKDVDWVGDISNIDQSARTFMFTIPGSANKDRKPAVLKISVPADAKIRIGNSEVSFSSLANGMRAHVYGFYNVNTQTITARRVDARSMVKPMPMVDTTFSATNTAQ